MTIIVKGGTCTSEEIDRYIDYVQTSNPNSKVEELIITLDGEYVDIDYRLKSVPFQRIRRITGYLVGTLDRFNNAKRSEVEDRVKHNIM